MNTDTIAFRSFVTAMNVNVYRADFAACTLELNDEKNHLFIIDEDGDSEEWELRNGQWLFTNGDQGQKPTATWPETYYIFVQEAIAAL